MSDDITPDTLNDTDLSALMGTRKITPAQARRQQRDIEIITIHEQNSDMSQEKIAWQVGCSRMTVNSILKHKDAIKSNLDAYKQARPDMFAKLQREILNTVLKKEKLAKLSVKDGINMAMKLGAEERLLRQESHTPQGFMATMKGIHIEIEKGKITIDSPFPREDYIRDQAIDITPSQMPSQAPEPRPEPQDVVVSPEPDSSVQAKPLINKD